MKKTLFVALVAIFVVGCGSKIGPCSTLCVIYITEWRL